MKTAKLNAHLVLCVIVILAWFINTTAVYCQTKPIKSFFEKKEGNYFGYGLAMGYKVGTLRNDISQLNSLKNSQLTQT